MVESLQIYHNYSFRFGPAESALANVKSQRLNFNSASNFFFGPVSCWFCWTGCTLCCLRPYLDATHSCCRNVNSEGRDFGPCVNLISNCRSTMTHAITVAMMMAMLLTVRWWMQPLADQIFEYALHAVYCAWFFFVCLCLALMQQ